MTAIVTFRQRDRITILSDASGYDAATGTLMRFVSKCQPITHLKAALAMRGSSVATSLFAANFGCVFTSFDDLVEKGGAFAEHLYDNRFAMLTASGETEVDMFLAGWSDARHRMEVYMLASHDRHGSEPWEFTLQEDPVIAAPVPPADVRDEFGIVFPSDPERIDPATIGIRIMEAQRSMRFKTTLDGDGEEFHLVGGHILLTQIKRDGIEQRVIHTWTEDKLGELITPRPKEVVTKREIVGELPPRIENRQQRRAWERENRRQKLHS